MTERTAEEWGRLAVSLPGWRWMPGIQTLPLWSGTPDPDDPATAGCLLALLGPLGLVMDALSKAGRMDIWSALMGALMHDPPALGRACIAVAVALGQWPGVGNK